MAESSARNFLLELVSGPRATQYHVEFQRWCGVQNGKPTNYLLHVIFIFLSSLGEEVAYITLMPLAVWGLGYAVGLEMVNVWVLLLVIGQIGKEVCCLPRPSDSKIAKLEDLHGTEYGMPSTHTMAGFLPYHFVNVAMRPFGLQLPFLVILFTKLVWLGVGLSRVYMGVHAIADVIGGSLLAMFVLTFWNYCGKELTAIILHPTVGWLFILSICSAFAVAFPRPVPWSSSVGTTSVIVGAWTGMSLGVWWTHTFFPQMYAAVNYGNTPGGPWGFTIRCASNFLWVFLARQCVKDIAVRAVLYGVKQIVTEDGTDKMAAVPLKKRYYVELPVKLITYGAVGFTVVFIGPYTSHWLGL